MTNGPSLPRSRQRKRKPSLRHDYQWPTQGHPRSNGTQQTRKPWKSENPNPRKGFKQGRKRERGGSTQIHTSEDEHNELEMNQGVGYIEGRR